MPSIAGATIDGFDYSSSMMRFARFVSKAYESLFAASPSLLSHEATHMRIEETLQELNTWKTTIPDLFNPDNSLRPTTFRDNLSMIASLKLRYHYYSAVMALTRLGLLKYSLSPRRTIGYRERALDAAKKVIELTTHIDIHSSLPAW